VPAQSFERWAPHPLLTEITGSIREDLTFDGGLSDQETWGSIKGSISDVFEFEFNGQVPGSTPDDHEKFDRTLLGDLYLVFGSDSAGVAKNLVLKAKNIASGLDDESLDGQLDFNIPAGILTGVDTEEAQAFFTLMQQSTAIEVTLATEERLGILGLDTSLTVVIVYSAEPSTTSIDLAVGGGLASVDEYQVKFNYSNVLGTGEQRPETHWHRRTS
jgi:hypothetical protein